MRKHMFVGVHTPCKMHDTSIHAQLQANIDEQKPETALVWVTRPPRDFHQTDTE